MPTSLLPGAALLGGVQTLAEWLDGGGDVDMRCGSHNPTLLIGATAVGQEAMVRLLLQRGASVNLQDSGGCTALMWAAVKGYTTIMQALLDAKADASLKTNNGKTALTCAAKAKQTAAEQLLRQHAKRQAAEATVMQGLGL